MANPNAARDSLFTHVATILAALFCGFSMWLVVQISERGEITLELDVVPSPAMDSRVEISFARTKIPVRFTFQATELNKMSSENFRMVVDVPDLMDNFSDSLQSSDNVLLSREGVETELDMERLNITVTEILRPQLRWEATLRNMPAAIAPRITGEPAEGHVIGSVTVETDAEPIAILTETADLKYKAMGLDRIEIPTLPVDIAGRTSTLLEQVAIELPPGVSLWKETENPRRNIIVEILEQDITRTLSGLPIAYQFVSARTDLKAVVEPDRIDVLLSGPASAVNAITAEVLSFSLYAVEEAGEVREVPVSVRLNNPDLRARVTVATQPTAVTIRMIGPEKPPPTPVPTPRTDNFFPLLLESPAPPAADVTPTPAPALLTNDEPTS